MRKVTKRQRKIIRGANAAVDRSLRKGEVFSVGDTLYTGQSPLFAPVYWPGTQAIYTYRKAKPGIPFVRVGLKSRYIPAGE